MQTSDFQIHEQKLVHFNFQVNPSFSSNEKGDYDIKFSTAISKNMDKRITRVILSVGIFEGKSFEDNNIPFTIQLKMQGIFGWKETVSDELLKDFLTTNAPAVLLSYMRPLITQVTSFAGLPPLILPLINFTEVIEQTKT